MSIASKKWLIAPQAPASLLRQYRQITPALAQVLYNRGYSDPQEASKFLYMRDTFNPLERGKEMKDVRKAAARL